uniref:DDE_Tnp_1_7 domain-containing protein n=1 Tax=Caenorhabditis tropicalis TaxID=1561998 RepID=A0A1I7T530_9PELO
MTTTAEINPESENIKTERPNSPESVFVPKAAVGFDTADQKLRVIASNDISATAEKGDLVDVDGRMLTILEFCDSIESARVSCEEHATGMNGMGLSSIRYEQEDDDDAAQETSTSGMGEREGDIDMAELEEETMEEVEDVTINGFETIDPTDFGGAAAIGAIANLQQQIDDMRSTMRDAIAVTMNDLQHDVDRIQQKQESLVKFYQKFLGCGRDGRLMEPFSENYPSRPFDGPHVRSRATGQNASDNVLSHFEQLEKLHNARQQEILARSEIKPNPYVSGMKPKTRNPLPTSSYVKRVNDSADTGEQDYTFGTNGTQGKRIVNGIVKTVENLYYPFITREEEEECLEASNNQAPIYAQLLAKLLFADTIMMYFKDQDTAKRNWLHDAVDYRFPTLDKPTHVSKWKNCSFFINKNMREAVIASGNPMPRAPCGPRGPIGPKDKFKNELKGSEDVSMTVSGDDEDEDDISVVRTPKGKATSFIKRESSLENIEWDYLDSDYEKECFEECRGDQYKYAELMALRLFSTSLAIKFKEQDQVKKEWLRTCVEARFPMDDRERNDQRWKICGQTCNRNRTKIVGADGREERYPYFDQSIEEECFRQSEGQVAVYAELMNAKLFPNTQHMFFKDQDLGKRNWLHTILDKRFPSTDKVTQTSKWKACTNAINKKLFDGTVTPITREAFMNNGQDDIGTPKVSIKEEVVETPRSSAARFERRMPSEPASSIGSLKRKATEDEATPAPTAKRESIRNKQKKEKELYSAYPYVSEEEEVAIFEASNGNPQVYGRELGRVLFADTIKNYFKDQDADKRQWIHEILDFRFPSKNQLESKQKWKNVTAAINRNMTSAAASRRSLPR